MGLPSVEQAFVDYQALVRHVVYRFERNNPEAARAIDCLSEGFIAFLKAYQKYKVDNKGIMFSTYLTYRVQYHLMDVQKVQANRARKRKYVNLATVKISHDWDAIDMKLDRPEGFKNYKEAKSYVHS